MSCYHCGSTGTWQLAVQIDGERVSVCANADECRKNRAQADSEHPATTGGQITGSAPETGIWADPWMPEPFGTVDPGELL